MTAAFDLLPQRPLQNEAMTLKKNRTFSRPDVSGFNRMNVLNTHDAVEKIVRMRREDFLVCSPAKIQEAKGDDSLVSASIEELNEALAAAFGVSPGR